MKHRKKLIPSKKNNKLAIHADFSPCKYEVDEMRHNPTKTQKSIHSWSNHFWNPIANVSVKVQYEKTSI